MRKFCTGAVILALSLGVAQASSVDVVCDGVTLEVMSHTSSERAIDSCEGLSNCFQRADGSSYHNVPVTQMKVLAVQGAEGCPAVGSRMTVLENIPADRIKARLSEFSGLGVNGPIVGYGLNQLRTLDGSVLPGVLGQSGVTVEQIVLCAGKGQTVSSGLMDTCCAGLIFTPAISDPAQCSELEGGGVCLPCGDGQCESTLENSCNCPQDCQAA